MHVISLDGNNVYCHFIKTIVKLYLIWNQKYTVLYTSMWILPNLPSFPVWSNLLDKTNNKNNGQRKKYIFSTVLVLNGYQGHYRLFTNLCAPYNVNNTLQILNILCHLPLKKEKGDGSSDKTCEWEKR